MTDLVLEAADVRLAFGGLVALDGVSIPLQAEEIHGIVGPNGAGKTTTFDVMSGVYRPSQGSVRLGGTDISSWSPHRRTQAGLARSFQTVGLAPGLTARDNVLATVEALHRVRMPYPRPSATRRRGALADELLAYFQLEEVAHAQVTDLPLGTTKLLELAKVFAGEPKAVLLDEPFAGLSSAEAMQRVELISERRVMSGAGVVIVEHDVPLLIDCCHRITVLDAGRVVATGEPHEVMADPRVREAYMGELVEDNIS